MKRREVDRHCKMLLLIWMMLLCLYQRFLLLANNPCLLLNDNAVMLMVDWFLQFRMATGTSWRWLITFLLLINGWDMLITGHLYQWNLIRSLGGSTHTKYWLMKWRRQGIWALHNTCVASTLCVDHVLLFIMYRYFVSVYSYDILLHNKRLCLHYGGMVIYVTSQESLHAYWNFVLIVMRLAFSVSQSTYW